MIQFLELKNFRAFEHIRFKDLGRANLDIGGNRTRRSTTKTADFSTMSIRPVRSSASP